MRRTSFSPVYPQEQDKKRLSTSFSLRKRKKRPNPSEIDTQAYQKFMKTSYIMSNIKKAIKNNDINLINGQKVQKLRTQPTNTGKQSQQITAHQALIDIRRKYDAMKRERVRKVQQTQKIKERLKTFSVYEEQCISRLKKGKNSSTFYRTWVDGGHLQNQYKFMDRNVYKHVSCRLKQDIKFYKQQIVKNKRKLGLFQQKSQSLVKQYEKLSKQTSNAQNLLKMLTQSIRKQEKQRFQHLQDIKQRIFQRLTIEQTEQNRFLFQQKEAQNAILSKNEEEKNWYLLFLSHLFVKRMLINKIEKQMEKFKVVEEAYQKIKSKTVIKNVQDLKQRFFNRNSYYGSLLNEITKRKQKIQSLTQENVRLTKENEYFLQLKSKYENKSQNNFMSIFHQNQTQQQKQLEKEFNNITNVDIQLKKYIMALKQWIPIQIIKVCLAIQVKPTEKQIKNRSIKDMLLIYLNYLKQFLKMATHQQLSEINPLENGNRRQPKIQKKKSQISIENNQIISVIPNDMNQKMLQTYKPEDELMIVNLQRQQMIHNNEKFMKSLRNRYIENKRRSL